jgi:feruloyl esterase
MKSEALVAAVIIAGSVGIQWTCGSAAENASAAAAALSALPPRAELRPVIGCSDLLHRDFSRVAGAPTRVLSAAIEPAKNGTPDMCLVKGYVAPTIQFELRLPTSGYTGRYLQGGCGGNCGRILVSVAPTCDNRQVFSGAFAVGFEDSGHGGGDGVWALGSEQVRIDFSYRASHAFAQAAKAIIAAYFDQPPTRSYFQGCSDGGREAMSETQRYPDDFDGVIAGSPAHQITEAMERFMWEARWSHNDQHAAIFDAASLTLLHDAVVKSCDGLDGLVDGQIDDPRSCHFDPRELLCRRDARLACLTSEQIAVAIKFYDGPRDPSGVRLYMGGEPYGSELTWAGPGSFAEAGTGMLEEAVRSMIYLGELPDSVTVRSWSFDLATFHDLSRRGAIYDAHDPDLKRFKERGGKLILWQGTADPAAGNFGVLDYYQQVQDRLGGLAATREFARVFLVPAVYHCGRGYIAYEEDFLGAMVNWVEQGVLPDSVTASATLADGKVRNRPVYAYPVRARYRGKGDFNDAASFRADVPDAPINDAYDWAGAPARP